MPRPLVYSNGSLLIGIDAHGAIRDLYYPQVGLFNHLNGYSIRMGVWANGRFAWCDANEWHRELTYSGDGLVGKQALEHQGLGVRLQLEETVDWEEPNFLRSIQLWNLTEAALDLRLFFTHDLRIAESDIGDTAYYAPTLNGVVHYKGPHYFLFGGSSGFGGLQQWATGIKGFGGMEGTWRDAEDGRLSMNPIAQGSVDSTIGLHLTIGPLRKTDADYWIICGSSLDEISERYHRQISTGLSESIESTASFWLTWISKARDAVPELNSLPEECIELFQRSIAIIRSQIDRSGAIIAANDSDILATNRATYSYMWPRDGAHVSAALSRLGYRDFSERFFKFCAELIKPEKPFFFQKYRADATMGAAWHPWIVDDKPTTPFQEDETALVLSSLAEFQRQFPDSTFAQDHMETFVLPMAAFLLNFRDHVTHLPSPSWDLWEERRGIHAFTVAAVVQGLRSAAELVAPFDKLRSAAYLKAAEETASSAIESFFDAGSGAPIRRLEPLPGGKLVPDTVIDSAVLSFVLFDVLDPTSDLAINLIRKVEEALTVRSVVGGIARYEGDYYFRQTQAYPGNPWFISTLWLAQSKIKTAQSHQDLDEALDWLRWTAHHAAETCVLSEQIHPDSGEPLSVSPLTWSHAEYLWTVLDYLEAAKRLY